MLNVLATCLVACLVTVTSLPQFMTNSNMRTLFQEPMKDIPGAEKNFTGIKLRNDSSQVVYHHEQTIAVVEVSTETRELYNCELLEVKTNKDKKAALTELKKKIKTQIKISFNDIKNLMQQCEKLSYPRSTRRALARQEVKNSTDTEQFRGFGSIFNGVYPGTKWCGTGDIATTYFDLGDEAVLDKCCRTHDLCPVKVAGFKTQYNITNYSLYTRSHCDCDEQFLKCLKKVNTGTANLLGSLYFNVASGKCVEDVRLETDPKKRVKRLRILNNRY